MGTIIASMVLAGMFALAVRSIYRDMKTGGCCGGCSAVQDAAVENAAARVCRFRRMPCNRKCVIV